MSLQNDSFGMVKSSRYFTCLSLFVLNVLLFKILLLSGGVPSAQSDPLL